MQKVVLRKRNKFHARANKLSADGKELVKISIVLAAAIGLVTIMLGLFRWVRIDEVECQTQRGRCTPEMVTYLNGYKGQFGPLAAYKIAGEIKQEFGFVNEVNSQIIWPSTIKVDTRIDTPAIMVSSRELSQNGHYYTVTFDGIVMEKMDSFNEPLLIVQNLGTNIGKKMDAKSVQAVQITYHLAALGYKFQAQANVDEMRVLTMSEGSEKLAWFDLNSENNPAEKVSAFSVIIKQAHLSDKPMVIDMRYERPVIREYIPSVAGEKIEMGN